MDVTATNFATDAFSLSKKQTESDILQRSIEKQDDVQALQKAGEPKVVEQSSSDKNGRIDFYA